MLGMPKTTEFNKRIPKQKFYENLDVSQTIKKIFVEQVKVIYWKNKIAETTVNIKSGKEVKELEIFEIRLAGPDLDENLLKLIDREIPYHILFILEYMGKYQAWIGYKEAALGNKAFKVSGYYHTGWMEEENLSINLKGLDLDEVYENFVRQIAGDKLVKESDSESLKESVEKEEKRQIVKKQIDKLKAKIKKEKQINKKMELNNEIKKLKKQLEEL